MEIKILKTVGQIAGVGGIALGVLFLVFKEVLHKSLLLRLTQDQAYWVIQFILGAAWFVAIIGLLTWAWVKTRVPNNPQNPVHPNLQTTDEDSANVETGIANTGTQTFQGPVHIGLTPEDVKVIVDTLQASHQRELDRKETDLVDWKKQATEAVTALAALQGKKDTPSGVERAFTLLKQGKTEAAEAIFQEVASRKENDVKEAAAAYRHLGAIAFLAETDKAQKAYQRATELEPDNADGWNQLGHLLNRSGEPTEAEKAYRQVEGIGTATGNQVLLAAAYNNLGIIYKTRGDLAEAEAMYRKSLEIDETLGNKEEIAKAYNGLGNTYKTRGDLDQAVVMCQKCLKIEEALGRKGGMASAYGNLGILYHIRGDLDQAKVMYHKSLEISEALGDTEVRTFAYGNLGSIYQNRGDLDQAVVMYQKSLEINETLGNKEEIAKAYNGLGNTYKTRGD
ncbi:MAG: tetratricopeptide repeat protein, partial [Deltaproteobacteria bacterium]|nr:tetratricopeptide repeat protein [Deltaproteobacteria bacterium]